jgi:circadian clock protein KaiB
MPSAHNVAQIDRSHYVLRLFVSGMTPQSLRAVENIKRVCETALADRYSLEIIDVYACPGAATDERIVAVPTLVKRLPLPLRKIIGDLSNSERVLIGLDIAKL